MSDIYRAPDGAIWFIKPINHHRYGGDWYGVMRKRGQKPKQYAIVPSRSEAERILKNMGFDKIKTQGDVDGDEKPRLA